MNKLNNGVINQSAGKEAEHFDAPFSVEKTINLKRVARCQKPKKTAQFQHFLSRFRFLLVIIPMLVTMWILIIATASIIIEKDSSGYSFLIVALDFFIICFILGTSLELHDALKRRSQIIENSKPSDPLYSKIK